LAVWVGRAAVRSGGLVSLSVALLGSLTGFTVGCVDILAAALVEAVGLVEAA